jgi:hypothetical protein
LLLPPTLSRLPPSTSVVLTWPALIRLHLSSFSKRHLYQHHNLNKHPPQNALYHFCTRERCLDFLNASDRFESARARIIATAAWPLTPEGTVIGTLYSPSPPPPRRQRPLSSHHFVASLYNTLSTPSFHLIALPLDLSRPFPSTTSYARTHSNLCSGEHRWNYQPCHFLATRLSVSFNTLGRDRRNTRDLLQVNYPLTADRPDQATTHHRIET